MLARGEISAPGCQRLAGSGGFSLGFAANVCTQSRAPRRGSVKELRRQRMAGGEGERRRREARSRLRGAGGRGGGRGGRARAVGLHGTAARPANGLILGTGAGPFPSQLGRRRTRFAPPGTRSKKGFGELPQHFCPRLTRKTGENPRRGSGDCWHRRCLPAQGLGTASAPLPHALGGSRCPPCGSGREVASPSPSFGNSMPLHARFQARG